MWALIVGAALPAFILVAFIEAVWLQLYLGQYATLGAGAASLRPPAVPVLLSLAMPALVAGALMWARFRISVPRWSGLTWPIRPDLYAALERLRRRLAPREWTWHQSLLTTCLLLAGAASVIADAAARSPAARPWAQWLWMMGIGLMLLAAVLWRRPVAGAPRWTFRTDAPALVLLCAFGLVLRLPNLGGLPYVVHGDEGVIGLQALRWLQGDVHSLFETGWSGLPMGGYGWPALVMRFVGFNLYGLRLSSVLLGTLSVVGTYALAREFVRRRVAFVAAALVATIPVHIQFSRTGFHYITAVAVVTLTLWLLVRALRIASAPAAVLAGVGMSVALQVYFGARILFIIVPLFLLALLLVERRMLVGRGAVMAWFAGSLAVTLGPLLVFLAASGDALVARASEVQIFAPGAGVQAHLISQFGTADLGRVLPRQLAALPLLPSGLADQSLQFGGHFAAFDALVAGLLLVGLFGALLRPRHALQALLLIWVLATVLIGGVLTVDFPSWPRLLVVTPALMLLAALAADELVSPVERFCALRLAQLHVPAIARQNQLVAAGVSLVLLSAVLGFSLQQTWVHYFVDYPRAVNNDPYRTRFTDLPYYILKLPASRYAILFTQDDVTLSYDAPAFLLAGRHRQVTVRDVPTLKAAIEQHPGSVVMVPATAHAAFEQALQAGVLPAPTAAEQHTNAVGAALFATYSY